MYEILNAECMDAMGGMEPDSIDAIVTDPPYGLAFMGARWDSFNGRQTTKEWHGDGNAQSFQEAMTPIFKETLKVAKPGAYMLCFGGTRTFHRLACAIEDAGWNIKDCIMWVHSQGFPKGMDVGKAIDKTLGAERKVVGTRKIPVSKSWREREGRTDLAESMKYVTVPSTEQAQEWDGWNTQLKPAWEPIIVAQKPLDGTVAHNVMTHGTGAINIDGCRVGTEAMVNRPAGNKAGGNSLNMSKYGMPQDAQPTTATGRFPANLIHDGSQEVLELFPNDSGRFFYCAKASKSDRNSGGVDNDHNTVKPNKLMRYLVRMVCRKGGTLLDPFMGSGSTGVACMQEGMSFVGIDMDEHYCEIAEKRIASAG